ncbi:preprotein translocase subunit YajC [Clostridium luticellarii]|uniref:Preprotein translocase subunit YajC n=1 Tax=Clostridium luticellarii TaxID=1691940 RepID=A0A2T0BLK7_9CLOT|nr:preprotein translocase subunit YajC [Clostridium luticellarii]MCI1944296.1 preprotein translocase subunit YajC [Clostridium luticellarii]MCI1967792.1 preprotein translocase subunit YajC [Clostridium luticellarii]MCI1994670.1 preprotein translocase subunit YajC [Clostridium luticellarii]MCI2038833.1 preprotein translocase subunit YajC [Clostridium luticellarii]PRR84780.1 preprotein translocase subunit YajC [Clostridium luticellarii]
MDSLIRLAPWIVIIAFFYLLVFLPESRRRKKYNTMLSNLKVNDQVITKGGIIGKIINIRENESFITIQTGPDRIKIKLDKTGVLNVLSENKTSEDSGENKIEGKKEV